MLLQNSEDAKQLRRVQELQGNEWVSLKDKIIKFSRYILIIAPSWHHVNPKSTPISYYVSNVTLASEWPQTGGKSEGAIIPEHFFGFSGRLSGQFEAILGVRLQKIFCIYPAEELKYISVIFVTNKDVLLCFYFYR